MAKAWVGHVSGLAFLCLVPAWGQPHTPKLVPTDYVAGKVREIQSKFRAPLTQTTREGLAAEDVQREKLFSQMKGYVTAFVILQLEADPGIEPAQMRDQIMRIHPSADYFHKPPYAFRVLSDVENDTKVWAVIYQEWLYPGSDSGRTVVEAYVVENGKARLAGRGGAERNGYRLAAEQISSPEPNSTAILVHGIMEWSSGHELPAAAVLYGISQTGVKVLWQLNAPGFRYLGSDGSTFKVDYHDEDRHQRHLQPYVYDVYRIGEKGEVHRIVHQY